MKKMLYALALLPSVAMAQDMPFVPSCIIQDSISIRDEGMGVAVVTYYNSVESCSQEFSTTLTSEAGVEVKVQISIGGEEDDYREIINLTPLTDGMMAYPPDGKLLDGETQEFYIMGGLS